MAKAAVKKVVKKSKYTYPISSTTQRLPEPDTSGQSPSGWLPPPTDGILCHTVSKENEVIQSGIPMVQNFD